MVNSHKKRRAATASRQKPEYPYPTCPSTQDSFVFSPPNAGKALLLMRSSARSWIIRRSLNHSQSHSAESSNVPKQEGRSRTNLLIRHPGVHQSALARRKMMSEVRRALEAAN